MLPFPDAGLADGAVRLRRWRRSDLDELVAACQDPEIPRWTTVPSPYTAESGRWFFDRCDEWWEAGTDLPLAIVDDADRVLGATGIHRIGATREAAASADGLPDEVGYWLAAHARGRGVVTAALNLLVPWCREELGRGDLWLRADPENERSIAAAVRCGFTPAGATIEMASGRELRVYRHRPPAR